MAGWVSLRGGTNTERVVFYSDAVFAIAMTLLVVDLRLPEVPDTEVGSALLELIPGYVGFVVSFTVIAVNWMLHHRKFQLISRWDETLVSVNFVLLGLVAFLPSPTSVFSEHPRVPIAITLYTVFVALLSLSQWLVWTVAVRRGLVRRDVPRDLVRAASGRGFPIVVCFLLAAVLAWVSPIAAYVAMGLSGIVASLANRTRKRVDLDQAFPAEEPDAGGGVR